MTPMDRSEKQDMLCSAFTTDARKSNKQVTNLKQWHQKFDHERTLITNSLLTFHERTTFSNHELFAHLFLLTNLTGSPFDCFIPCSSLLLQYTFTKKRRVARGNKRDKINKIISMGHEDDSIAAAKDGDVEDTPYDVIVWAMVTIWMYLIRK